MDIFDNINTISNYENIEEQYYKENTEPMIKNEKLSKCFKTWLRKKWRKDEMNDAVLYRKETGKIPYEKDNKTLTKEFVKWHRDKVKKS